MSADTRKVSSAPLLTIYSNNVMVQAKKSILLMLGWPSSRPVDEHFNHSLEIEDSNPATRTGKEKMLICSLVVKQELINENLNVFGFASHRGKLIKNWKTH